MKDKIRKKILILLILFCITNFPPAIVRAAGASLYLSPGNGTFFVGNTFDISILVNTNNNDINAVKVELKFDPKKLQIANPTTGRSFISVWVAQPNYSNVEGTAFFQGGVPSPGINTTAGLVSTITFRAIAPGETNIYFSEDSKVLLNDGKGTNILNSINKGAYTLLIPPPEGPIVFSSTHPDQNKWYKNNSPSFSWEKGDEMTDFSYSIDNDYSGVPDNISEGNQTNVSYTDMKDGIWYFHIKAKKGQAWGGVSHYVVQIDTTPPAVFNIDFEPKLKSPRTTSREPIVTFLTTDALSGTEHYELKVVSFDSLNKNQAPFFTETASPYKLPQLNVGENEIIVRAFDAAGNWRDASKKIEVISLGKILYITENGINIWLFLVPWWLLILFILIVLIIIFMIILLHRRRSRELNKIRKNLQDLKEKTEKNTWGNL
jgi:hypothetical protein